MGINKPSILHGTVSVFGLSAEYYEMAMVRASNHIHPITGSTLTMTVSLQQHHKQGPEYQ